MRVLPASLLSIAMISAFGACGRGDETEPYPVCQPNSAEPAPTTNTIYVDTQQADFTYSSSLCYYVLRTNWDQDVAPVRIMGTVSRLLPDAEAESLRQRSCEADNSQCWYAPILEVTVSHDFDGQHEPGTTLDLLVVMTSPEDATSVYVGNRLMFFGTVLKSGEANIVVAGVPAMFTIRNCYVFASNSEAITPQFGNGPVTEAEMAALVESAIANGTKACVVPVYTQ